MSLGLTDTRGRVIEEKAIASSSTAATHPRHEWLRAIPSNCVKEDVVADLEDASFFVKMGPVWLQLRNGKLMLGVSKDEPLPRGVLPSLYKGLRADHLTIPLSTRRHGKYAGSYYVHLTYQEGEHSTHVGVAGLYPEDLQRFFAHVQEYLDGCYQRSVFKVSPAELSRQGYGFVLFDKDFVDILEEKFRARGKGKGYRITHSRLELLADDAMLVDVCVLDDPAMEMDSLPQAPLFLIGLEPESGLPDLWLRCDKHEARGDRPGWHAWPRDWLPRDFIVELINQHVGPEAWEAMRKIGVELGLPLDFDKLNQLIAQASVQQSLPDGS